MVCQGYRNCWTCERNSNIFLCWPAGKGRDVEMQQLKWLKAVVWVWSLISLNKLHKTNFEWTILKMFKCGWFVSLYKWAFKHTHTHLSICTIWKSFQLIWTFCKSVTLFQSCAERQPLVLCVCVCVQSSYRLLRHTEKMSLQAADVNAETAAVQHFHPSSSSDISSFMMSH